MYFLESEIIGFFNNLKGLEVISNNCLYAPIQKFSLIRDSNLRLILETESKISSATKAKDIPLGKVYMNDSEIVLKDRCSTRKVSLNGINSYSINDNNYGRLEKSYITSIESIVDEKELDEKYLIEFVSNISEDFLFPDFVKSNKGLLKIDKIEFKDNSENISFSKGYLKVCIDDISIHVCSYIHNKKKYEYILYDRVLSNEERRKIVNCISFIIGKPILSLGYVTYSTSQELVNFKLNQGYDYKGAFNLPTLPPTLLSNSSVDLIDSKIFQQHFISLYNSYDEYDYSHLFWLYWHASCSHFYSASVQFGACIESLQKKYLDKHSSVKIFESKSNWKTFRSQVLNIIEELKISEDQKKLLIGKIENANVLPQKLQLKKFFNELEMELSNLELNTWDQRNIPAHGKKVENNIDYIRGIKILRTLVNRIILKISGVGEYYFDYYNLGQDRQYKLSYIKDGIKEESN
ncbi:hypothetical protein [Francisella philomiragia]|uniref:ApeA N-terminal domain-containing protein n=1 Tax=Francisella philomiragia TaxID=28110 RepID=A0A0B6CQH9_9GAMM|nr:hypothetical protein [Francisella philomiragia]AJI52729.1 hypothetical protein LA55_275 [Francisella philomiragia]